MRILFITSTYVGDAVVSTGLLGHLLDRHPDARVTVICGRPSADIFAEVPNLDRVVTFTKRKLHLHWFDLWKTCVPLFWDIVVDLRGSGMAYMLAARRRYVFRPKTTKWEVRTREWAEVLGLDELPAPRLWTGPEQDAAARALVPDGPPVICVGPTSNWPPKSWPPERFAELAARLSAPGAILDGARVAVFGAPGDEIEVAPLLRAIPQDRLINLIGKTDLLTAGAVMRRCALHVGNDSGLLYLSAAADIPALGLFGPTPGLFGRETEPLAASWAPKVYVVRTRTPMEELLATPGVDERPGPALMDSLTVDDAEQAALALWKRSGQTAAA